MLIDRLYICTYLYVFIDRLYIFNSFRDPVQISRASCSVFYFIFIYLYLYFYVGLVLY